MKKIHKSFEAVYIISFNKINLCKYSKEAVCFRRI